MQLEVENRRLEVTRAAAVLRLGETPTVRATLGSSGSDVVTAEQVVGRVAAKLTTSPERGIETQLRGRVKTPSVTLVLEPCDRKQQDWLRAANERRAVYQRLEDDAWAFLGAVFADRLSASDACKQTVEAWLPRGACLLREAGASTGRWITELADALAGAGVVGWYGRLRTDSIRLVSTNDPPHELTACHWVSDLVTPPAAGTERSRLTLQGEVHLGNASALMLLDEILRDAESLSVDHALLRARPGLANIHSETVLVESAAFEYAGDVEADKLNVQLTVRLPVEPNLPLARRHWRVPATVNGWVQDGWEEGATSLLEIALDEIESPATVDPRNVEERSMVAQALSPAPVRDSAAGFYARRGDAHAVVLDLVTGEMPLVLGAIQTHDEELEAAQLSLQSETVAITSSPRGSALAEAAGLHLEGTDGVGLRTSRDGQVAFTTGSVHLEAEQRTTLKASVVTVEGETTIDGKTTLAGEVEMGSA
ncbi:MAG: hypothetical protein AAGM22_26795 [Acidobacteriota bacterium]